MIDRLKNWLFGKKSETISEEQDHEATLVQLDTTNPGWDQDSKLARKEYLVALANKQQGNGKND